MLLPLQTVGVMGDGRTFEDVIAIRSVNTDNFMTADWSRLPYDLLQKISSRITNSVRGVNRVVYDISSKPPARSSGNNPHGCGDGPPLARPPAMDEVEANVPQLRQPFLGISRTTRNRQLATACATQAGARSPDRWCSTCWPKATLNLANRQIPSRPTKKASLPFPASIGKVVVPPFSLKLPMFSATKPKWSVPPTVPYACLRSRCW